MRDNEPVDAPIMKDALGRKHYFQVTSHGRTATYWLAAALNDHPDFLCGHGGYLPPVLEYFERPEQTTTLDAHRNHGTFIAKSLGDVFAALTDAGEAKAYGMVHAYAAHHLAQWPQLANPTTPPIVVNIVRHPVTRIESLMRQLMHETKFSNGVKDNLDHHFDAYVDPAVRSDICARPGVDYTELKTRAFIYATASVLVFDTMDLALDFRHLAMEQLVVDRDLFAWLIGHLSGGAASASTDYLEKVFSMGQRNHHVHPISAAERFARWSPWQADITKLLLEKHDAENLYRHFGFDFSFLR
jgi:hypothetical protein